MHSLAGKSSAHPSQTFGKEILDRAEALPVESFSVSSATFSVWTGLPNMVLGKRKSGGQKKRYKDQLPILQQRVKIAGSWEQLAGDRTA